MGDYPVNVARTRYLRHRNLDGLTRGAEGATQDSPRLKRLGAWVDAKASVLSGTGAGQTFTAAASDIATITTHGRSTGDGPFTVSSTVTLPAGLAIDTQYWLNVIDVNTFTLHRSVEDAHNGTNAVDITDAGTGVHTMIPDDRAESVTQLLRQGNKPERIEGETDVDNLI